MATPSGWDNNSWKENYVRASFWVHKDRHAVLKIYAHKEGLKMTDVYEIAVRDFAERIKKGVI